MGGVELEHLWPDPDRRSGALARLALRVEQGEQETNGPHPRRFSRPARETIPTPSELRCLEAVSHGLGMHGAADVLGIAFYTVQSELKMARRRIAAKDTTHAVAIALRNGWIH